MTAATTWAPAADATADEAWRTQAACRDPQHDPDWWTGDGEQRRFAAWVCHNLCPVRDDCAQWADHNRELVRDAIYGGIYWTAGHRSTAVRPCPIQPAPRRPWGSQEPACGTQAAVSRHRRHRERLDEACLRFDTWRRQRARAAQ